MEEERKMRFRGGEKKEPLFITLKFKLKSFSLE
jgi:hypothetical protein